MLNDVFQLVLCGMLSTQATAHPADEDADPGFLESIGSRLEFRLTPGLYLPRLVGTTKLGPSSAAEDLDFRFDFDLNGSEQILNVEFSITKDDHWQILFNGFDFDTSRRAQFDSTSDYGSLTFNPGDDYHGEFSMNSFAIEISYRKWRHYQDHETVDLFFSPTFGVRMYGIEQIIEKPGVGREETREDYLNPYTGIQLDLRWQAREKISWLERLEINAGIFIGPALGADSGFGWSIRATLNLFFTENMSFLFGYRLYELDIEDGEYKLDGGLQGLFLGGTVRF